MDFAATLSFLFLYYIRPQEWIPAVGLLRPVTLTMAWAVVGTLFRKGGLGWREFFRTPHDGLVLAYFLWIVLTARSPVEALLGVYNLYLFYVVTVLALSSLERIGRYMAWWTGLIVAIAALGVASTLGLDPLGSREVTMGAMQGRLALGTLMFDNANALGHSVVPVLLMLFVLVGWIRPLLLAAVAIPSVVTAAYCVYLTFSKGAYISGFFTTVVVLCFGRPRILQVALVAGALTLGTAGLRQLPRMSTMANIRSDEGILRRTVAFRFGYDSMRENPTGLGFNRFVPKIIARGGRLVAGPHSSYVRVGGEFGLPGLFLFSSILVACYRTLYTASTLQVGEERIRRVLLVLLVSFTFSSWAIDWSVSAYFTLIVAAIAAFHRHLLARGSSAAGPAAVTASDAPARLPRPGPSAQPGADVLVSTDDGPRPRGAGSGTRRRNRRPDPWGTGPGPGQSPWNRIRWLDVGLFAGATVLVMFLWRHAMNAV